MKDGENSFLLEGRVINEKVTGILKCILGDIPFKAYYQGRSLIIQLDKDSMNALKLLMQLAQMMRMFGWLMTELYLMKTDYSIRQFQIILLINRSRKSVLNLCSESILQKSMIVVDKQSFEDTFQLQKIMCNLKQ